MFIQLLRQYGYEVTPANYAAWVHACILTQDMPGVVEALIEAEVLSTPIIAYTYILAYPYEQPIHACVTISIGQWY